jgi:hypothetical protein
LNAVHAKLAFAGEPLFKFRAQPVAAPFVDCGFHVFDLGFHQCVQFAKPGLLGGIVGGQPNQPLLGFPGTRDVLFVRSEKTVVAGHNIPALGGLGSFQSVLEFVEIGDDFLRVRDP